MASSLVSFSLSFSSLPALRAYVLSFSGTAALNAPYRFEVTALAETAVLEALGPEEFFAGVATLKIADGSRPPSEPGRPSAWAGAWHGIVTSFGTGASAGAWTALEVTLEPAVSRLRGQIQNRIHLDASSPDIVRDSLEFGGIPSNGMRFLTRPGAYPKREFVLQYGEDLLSFVLRTLEREGMGLSWDQTGGGDVAVFTDSNAHFPGLEDGRGELVCNASALSGLSPEGGSAQLFGLRRSVRVPRASVRLKDYNWENPNRPLEVKLPVAPWGRGEMYLYGENFATEAEGGRLASLRREEELCSCESWTAESDLPGLAPGLTLKAKGVAGPAREATFLVTALESSGTQAGRLSSGLGIDPAAFGQAGDDRRPALMQKVTLSRLDRAWRPRRVTPRPRISGSVTAWIDGAGSGELPEIDLWGRYKVLLPLDVSGRPNGKASSWIRMAQPSVGAGYGQSFPLTPGAEVLLTFVDGDPDRPVISGAVPNAETGAIVNSASPHVSGIGSKGGGGLLFGNSPEKQHVSLTSGTDRGSFVLAGGSPTSGAMSADILTSSSLANTAKHIFSSENTSGYSYSISASESFMNGILTLITAARTSAGLVSYAGGAVESAGKGYGNETVEESGALVKQVSGIIDDCGDFVNIIAQLAFKGVDFISKYREKKKHAMDVPLPPPIPPDTNIISIRADTEGGHSEWLSKKPFGGKGWRRNLLMWSAFMKPLRELARAATDTFEDFQSPSDVKNETMKQGIRTVSAVARAGSVLGDLVTAAMLMHTMRKSFNKEPVGLVMENRDSYVNILANTYGAFGARGPLLLESMPNQILVAEQYRLSRRDHDDSMDKTVASEADGKVPKGGFLESNAILLRGELVRTLCNEASVMARKVVAVRCPERIHLVAGSDKQPELYDYMPPQKHAAAMLVENDYDRGFAKGVDIEALDKGARVRVMCADDSGSIALTQGIGKGGKTADARRIMLDSKGMEFADKDGGSLTIIKKEVKLASTDNVRLYLSDKEASLLQDNNNSLRFSSSSGQLQHGTGLKLKGAQTQMELSAGGFLVDTKGKSEINGSIIKLG
ncbi:MAG: type VI secretion system tip protein VgrG [Deltaproteobacteria bacterium]|jgi:type VI secretion system VgrG family protein|nr:type VI secretion system tip protein VgrG [Deltaproteobacteria bacterium]